MEEISPEYMEDYAKATINESVDELIDAEAKVLKTLDFDLYIQTPFDNVCYYSGNVLDVNDKNISRDIGLFFNAVWRNRIRGLSYDSIAAVIATFMIMMYKKEDYSESIMEYVCDPVEYRGILENTTMPLKRYMAQFMDNPTNARQTKVLSFSILFKEDIPESNVFSVVSKK